MNTRSALFLDCGGVCYDSTIYFIRQIQQQFTLLGWHTEHYSFTKEAAAAGLKQLYGRHFDLILDINSPMPSIQDESGTYCLDQIDGPVWHYILDHPFYHHNTLAHQLRDYHIICLDENHAAFLKQYYPHLQKIIVLPLAAEAAQPQIPFAERAIPILFTGTYTNPNLILFHARKQSPEMQLLFRQTTGQLMEHPSMTQEAILRQLLEIPENETDLSSALSKSSSNPQTTIFRKLLTDAGASIPVLMQQNYLSDVYIQACVREELIKQMLLRRLPITVYGHDWGVFLEKSKGMIPDVEDYLKIQIELPYEMMPAVYANTQISLNQMPWFKAGMHDRISLALVNGCVSVTDESTYIRSRLTDGLQLCYYSLEDFEGAAARVQELYQNPAQAAQIASEGNHYAVSHFTWKHWVDSFFNAQDDRFGAHE